MSRMAVLATAAAVLDRTADADLVPCGHFHFLNYDGVMVKVLVKEHRGDRYTVLLPDLPRGRSRICTNGSFDLAVKRLVERVPLSLEASRAIREKEEVVMAKRRDVEALRARAGGLPISESYEGASVAKSIWIYVDAPLEKWTDELMAELDGLIKRFEEDLCAFKKKM